MLIKEYSLDPEAFAKPEIIKTFIRDFSLDKGRILSVAPKGWFRLVYDNLRKIKQLKKRKEAEILAATLQKWKLQQIARRSPARKYKEFNQPWIKYIHSFQNNPLDGVITFQIIEEKQDNQQKEQDSINKNNINKNMSPEDIWAEPKNWQVTASLTIQINMEMIFNVLNRAFTLSEEIYIIDPYFNLEDSQYWPFWEQLAKTLQQNQHINKIIILTADHKTKEQIIGRNKQRLEQIKNCQIWQADKNNVQGGFHDRFLLTDFVGFSFSNSFQEKPQQLMEITRLITQSYQQRYKLYFNNWDSYTRLY